MDDELYGADVADIPDEEEAGGDEYPEGTEPKEMEEERY